MFIHVCTEELDEAMKTARAPSDLLCIRVSAQVSALPIVMFGCRLTCSELGIEQSVLISCYVAYTCPD